MATEQATLGAIDKVVSALPQPGVSQTLIESATLSQDFNDAISLVRSVEQARFLTLRCKYTAHASATDGYAVILVMVSNARSAPAIGDDSWDALPYYDETSTDADIAAGVTLPTGADYSKGPNWRSLAVGGLLLQTETASSSEAVRLRARLDVADARWVYVAAVQQGDTTNFGTIAVDYALSLG